MPRSGKREDMPRSGKREEELPRSGKRENYMPRSGKRENYMPRSGKKENYMPRSGKKENYMIFANNEPSIFGNEQSFSRIFPEAHDKKLSSGAIGEVVAFGKKDKQISEIKDFEDELEL